MPSNRRTEFIAISVLVVSMTTLGKLEIGMEGETDLIGATDDARVGEHPRIEPTTGLIGGTDEEEVSGNSPRHPKSSK
jgi:hypothetical protein